MPHEQHALIGCCASMPPRLRQSLRKGLYQVRLKSLRIAESPPSPASSHHMRSIELGNYVNISLIRPASLYGSFEPHFPPARSTTPECECSRTVASKIATALPVGHQHRASLQFHLLPSQLGNRNSKASAGCTLLAMQLLIVGQREDHGNRPVCLPSFLADWHMAKCHQ